MFSSCSSVYRPSAGPGEPDKVQYKKKINIHIYIYIYVIVITVIAAQLEHPATRNMEILLNRCDID